MASFLSFLQNSLSGGKTVKDYTHAADIFRPNGFANAGKYKFLFHVYFNVNSNASTVDPRYLSYLVKAVELPKFSIDVKEMNQYNRKQLVQTKIKYNPITIKFHDDNASEIRSLWEDYYTYYYSDGRYDSPAYFYNDKYSDTRLENNWGLNSGSEEPYFVSVDVYSFHAGTAYKASFINPVITSFNHDTHDYAEGSGLMEHSMTIAYTSVKYTEGYAAGVPGFADSPLYDNVASDLSGSFAGSVIDPTTGQLVDPTSEFTDPYQERTSTNDAIDAQTLAYNNVNKNTVPYIDNNQLVDILQTQVQSVSPYVFPTASLALGTTIVNTAAPVSSLGVATTDGTILGNNQQYIGVYETGTWQRALEEKGYDPRNINIAADYINQGISDGTLSYVTNNAIAQQVAEQFLSDPVAVNQYTNPVYAASPTDYTVNPANLTSTNPVYNAASWQLQLTSEGYTQDQINYAQTQLNELNLSDSVDVATTAKALIDQYQSQE